MLTGTADLAELAEDAPTLEAFLTEPVQLEDVECFQLTAEMRSSARESVLPSGLHPTIPAALSLQAWNVGESPWGEFALCCCRVSCRSGVRARGFSTGSVVRGDAALTVLRDAFGFPARAGDVDLRRHYDGVDLAVRDDHGPILEIAALDPDPLGLEDVQYTGTLNLADTPLGLRLVQVESRHSATRVERLSARIRRFDGASWGNERLAPYRVIAASVALESIVIPPVRFVCKPDELAFTGTEPVDAPSEA
ncbi:MAG: hypothetical protein GWM88_18610 [Pseudomonadales bacterium]|nr:hypothetical protein [Pseudomonadales bacterium]NIX09937.1 hypothetical protein [Pseudomonadales bacterium]